MNGVSADALVVAASVFTAAWVVSLWRLRRNSCRPSGDRDRVFPVIAGLCAVLTGVAALTAVT